jgi:hypothetical protein
MPIQIRTWLGRLTGQVPGWYFWYAPHPMPTKPWHAVPAPPRIRVALPYRQPGRIDAATPQRLREMCRQRTAGGVLRAH